VNDKFSQADIITAICYPGGALLVLPDHVNAKNFPRLAALTQRAMKRSTPRLYGAPPLKHSTGPPREGHGARDKIRGPKPKETLNARASNLRLW
jgi:hypothetical protein